jgi:hypothetical protein
VSFGFWWIGKCSFIGVEECSGRGEPDPTIRAKSVKPYRAGTLSTRMRLFFIIIGKYDRVRSMFLKTNVYPCMLKHPRSYIPWSTSSSRKVFEDWSFNNGRYIFYQDASIFDYHR